MKVEQDAEEEEEGEQEAKQEYQIEGMDIHKGKSKNKEPVQKQNAGYYILF